MSEERDNPNVQLNRSWLFSSQGQRAISALINPSQGTQRATRGNRELETQSSSTENASENPEVHENIEVNRHYSFGEIDTSLIPESEDRETRRNRQIGSRTPSRASANSESELTSYDSSIFDPREIRYRSTMAQAPRNITASAIDEDIESLRKQLSNEGEETVIEAGTHRNRETEQMEIMVEFMSDMRVQLQGIQEHFHTQILRLQEQFVDLQEQQRDIRNTIRPVAFGPDNRAQVSPRRVTETNVTYGRGPSDIRSRSLPATSYMQLKEARSIIPEIDGTSQHKIQEFLSASTYAMESINPTEESQLLKAILCTKLKGKVMLDFQTRNIQTFAELKQELEVCYTTRKSIAHLQLEFNTLKQKQGEGAQAYGLRVDQLAMKLYESTIEGKGHTVAEKNTIKGTIQGQALQNFQLGLQEDIKIIVRSRNYSNLQEAIAVAASEEKMRGPNVMNKPNYKAVGTTREKPPQCAKCGKWGHHGRECRTSRFANRFNLPKADGQRVNALEKYCKHCKKTGHLRDECWLLNGRPEKGANSNDNVRPRAIKYTKSDKGKGDDSDNESEVTAKRTARPSRTY
ncbi:uncharacterized protein [Linepithema humile]|uniref:uncharacterized protein n=1 Tax=Linepithema humile TaxID=83485 RepID=UPI00351DFB00